MIKLVNLVDPEIVLLVKDAHIVGDRIVCDVGNDDFDLWKSSWNILVDIKKTSK